MTRAIDTTRRDALKVIAGAPLLPLATSLAGGTTFLFGMNAAAAAPAIASASFVSMPAPSSGERGRDGDHHGRIDHGGQLRRRNRAMSFTLAYEPFFITGAKVPDGKGGTVIDRRLLRHQRQADPGSVLARQADKPQFFSDCPDGMSLLQAGRRLGAGCQGQHGVCRRAVRIHHPRTPGGRRHVRPTAVADRRADAGSGQELGQAEAGQILGGGYRAGERPVDHLRGQPLALEHPSFQRGIRAGCHQSRRQALEGLQPASSTAIRRRPIPYHYGHLPEVTVNADGTGTVNEALLPRAHLARADPGHAGRAHGLDGR